ncbi:MAG: Flp pilus assembly protein CpaB [Propionicimonas sp.]|uniref:Flp pilus assembly protein CpaB n=1 Tax=Propionicimonas sp. TaxID=1955623 RepID=UPI003D126310
MQRRIIAAVAAVLLAGIGAVLLYNYVSNADKRAMANMETTGVLVVTQAVPAGTSGASLTPYVQLKQLPRMAVVDGALTDTSSVADLVTDSALAVGEQVLSSRFITPNTTSTGSVEVPANLQQVSIALEGTRTVGGTIQAGDKVALLITGPLKDKDDTVTAQALRNVLVVNVQGASTEGSDDAAAGNTLTLTLALDPEDVTRVVWGAENAKIWAALEPKDGSTNSFPVITGKTVLK